MTKLLRPTLLGIFLSVLAGPAHAENQASIQGTITEKRGYIMAGLSVMARNNSTGKEYETTSDATGAFSFDTVEPGRYVLASDCPGEDRILGSAVVEAGKTTQVELLALPLTETGNVAVDKFIASSAPQGGRYP